MITFVTIAILISIYLSAKHTQLRPQILGATRRRVTSCLFGNPLFENFEKSQKAESECKKQEHNDAEVLYLPVVLGKSELLLRRFLS
jgi:hypothetical protein